MQNYQKLILVTHRQEIPLSTYLKFIQQCAQSGITAVQLREKNASFDFLLEFGSRLKEILSPLHIPLIINDHISLAVQLDAAGVHLGQTDSAPLTAGKVLEKNKIIGVSIEKMAELEIANINTDLSYLAASAVFPTKNKNNLKTIWGIRGLREIVKASIHPVIAIGGIDGANIKEVVKTGVAGVAVIGALHDADDPAKATQKLRQVIDEEYLYV
jgi:thiamine-phosphate pyrophosphorylase